MEKLITQNSNPKHTPMSFKDYLESLIKDSERHVSLKYLRYFKNVAWTLLAYVAASYFHLPEKVGLREISGDKIEKILVAGSGAVIVTDQIAQRAWGKINEFSREIASYARKEPDEMMKIATNSVSSLKEKIAPLNTELEQAFLDLKVNKECYKKLAKVLDALDLSEHPNLMSFVKDVNDSLDKILSEADLQKNGNADSQKLMEVTMPIKLRAKL